MRVGSLFAGVGGFDIAAERAGMEVVWQSEVDDAASRVLEHHWPGLNLGDIHDIRIQVGGRPDTPRPDLPDDIRGGTGGTDNGGTDGTVAATAVDVLCGGFPCQDYSVAGNRAGLAGDRGALWWEYHRLITEGRPTWVVAENVPGLLSSRGGRDFATIIDSLTECGYGVVWAVLDAQYFGVAQRRRRVFIVGHSGGEPRPEVLALSEGVFGHPAPSREAREDTAGTLEARTRAGGFPGTDGAIAGHVVPVGSYGSGDYTGTVTTTWAKGPGNTQVEEGALVAFAEPHRNRNPEVYEHVFGTLPSRMGTGGNNGPMVAFVQNQRDEVRDLGGVAGALAAEPGMKQQTYVTAPQVRRLTPLECERLQGFPDGWTDTPGNSDTQRYRQMGNAVAVPVVEWILSRIANVENTHE